MYRNLRIRLLVVALVFVGVALATSVQATAFATVPASGEIFSRAPYVGADLDLREDNVYYQDCLRRRDAGDMKCGETCFWRECVTCANICTHDCEEDGYWT